MRQRVGKMQFFAAGQDIVSVEAALQSPNECTEAFSGKAKSGTRTAWLIYLAVALIFILPAANAFAQYEDGSLIGSIHDATGAAVANAAVAVTSVNTGIIVNVNANSAGDYEVPSLRAGVYNIKATAPGFASAEAKNITVSVGGRGRIDLTLKVGNAAATTVEVSDVALQLETESSQRGQTITEYQSEALPLVTRNYSDLVDYVTGTRPAPADATTTAVTSLTRAGSFNVNGQRSMFNDFMLDGMDNNAYGESNQGFDNQIIAPPPDSIAQFEVVTNNESAEYGRSSGGTINVATRSGSNEFHTTLYEFIRNTDLNAFGYIKPVAINALTGTQYPFFKPLFNRNQFGANFGGPLLKNRFFYFIDYEGFRQTLTPTVVDTVPTTNELNGNLAVAVQDPWHPGTYIPAGTPFSSWPAQAQADADPTALAIAKLYLGALPGKCTVTAGLAGSGVATNDCPLNAPFTDNADKGDLRLDFQQSKNSSWFLKVSDRKENGKNYNLLPEPIDMQTNGHILIHDEQIALGYTHVMGANKVLDARLALSGTKAGKWNFAIGNTSFPQGDIPGLPSIAGVSGGLPSMAISGGFTSFGRQSTNPQWQNPSLLDPKVNLSWVKGKQSFKFGYEYEHIWQEIEDSNPLYGSFTFGHGYSVCPGSAGTACPNTSNQADTYFADFLFGASSAFSLATYYITHVEQTMDSLYAQDDFKVDSRLTLNLGLRWEYGSPWSERNNYISNFNPATGTLLTLQPGYTASSQLCGTAPCIAPYSGSGVYGSTLVNPDWGDYAPRVGFAYALTPTLSLRGGYGTAFVHYWRAGSGNNIAINAPFALYTVVSNPGAVTTNGYVRLSKGFPTGLATSFSAGTDDIDYVPQNTKDGYAESYFLSVQKSLAKNVLVDVAYVGNHGVHLQGFINANQKNPQAGFINGNPALGWPRPYPNWGGYLLNNSTTYPTFNNGDISEALSGFWSHYNALQARYEQRFVGGLTLLNSFTWSHALDNASSTLEANTPCPQDGNNLAGDYGQSDYNLPVDNVTSLVYDLPFGQGRRYVASANPALNTILGGWQISAINTAQGGTPFNLTYSPATANAVSPSLTQNWRGENLYRPNLVPGTPYVVKTKALSTFNGASYQNGYVQWVNPAALTIPSTYVSNTSADGPSSPFGNLPKNYGRTGKFYETDLDFNKRFDTPIERIKIEFRSEFYNIFNHTNLYLPGGSGGGTVSGTDNNSSAPTSIAGGTITGTFEPRIVQFGLKVVY
jgi:outer membrane receptor protein involved in Fe transport